MWSGSGHDNGCKHFRDADLDSAFSEGFFRSGRHRVKYFIDRFRNIDIIFVRWAVRQAETRVHLAQALYPAALPGLLQCFRHPCAISFLRSISCP